MASVVISQEAVDYIGQKQVKPNVVIYRDILGLGCCAAKAFEFVYKVKVTGDERDEMFTLVECSSGVRVWAERAILPKINASNSVVITLKKGLLKGLQVQLGQELVGKV